MSYMFSLVFIFPITLAFNVNDGFPTKCRNFVDTRSNIPNKDFGRTVLTIPAHLTRNGHKQIRFLLASSHAHSLALIHEKQCKDPELVEIPLTVNEGHQGMSLNQYPFQDQWKFANYTYFTVDGYFHRMSNFWNPDDYCVDSISDTKLLIKLCKLNCAADLSKTYLLTTNNEPYEPSRICIPKCCGIDETLSLQDQVCRKLNDTEPNYFMPYLHLQQEIWFLKESKLRNIDTHKILVRPVLGRRQTWNSTHGISGGGQIWGLLHFTRNKMNCSRFVTESVFYSDVMNHGQSHKIRYNFRVEVRPGGVKVALLTKSRKWMEYKQEFCVDGLDQWGKVESTRAVNQVVLLCRNDDNGQISDKIKFVDEHKLAKTSIVDYLYAVFTLLLAVFLFVGSLIFWQIRKKLNFKGHLIRGHLNALTGLYLYTFVACVVFLSKHDRFGSNAVTVVSSEFTEGKRIGWFCALIGAICQYVYMSVFFWVGGMMCYDFGGCSDNMRKGISIMIGLGLPLILMTVFGIADVVFSDPWSDVVVPDYGVESCFVASWSAGYYLYLPVAIILGLIFIYAFVWFIRNFKVIFGEHGINGTFDNTRILLHVVLLTALTFRWIIDATKWLRVYNEQKEDNWFQILLIFVGIIVPAMVLFHVYCMNEVVLGLAGNKFSSVHSLAKVLKKKKLVWSGRGLIGQICDEVADEDTIIIEGETMLKEARAE